MVIIDVLLVMISNQPAISVGSVTSLEPSQTVLNCSGTGNSLCRTIKNIKPEGKNLKTVGLNWTFRDHQGTTNTVSWNLIFDTHIFFILWNQDVHLWALCTDNVAVEGVLTQVDLAAFCLVDGNGGNPSQHLWKSMYIKQLPIN